ncbi:hypothetical protein LOK49_LG09G00030 [Camellia lanceoleosa]|uniref:Uncharacterized protein n=1 Tax=Camellia lanceoleosa TaxID=1840588 RepID=A0ACC0GKS6_9ERIC|nr:hypothetical protein LOK49_LG09G00030 [Camellia lanceoleosa]
MGNQTQNECLNRSDACSPPQIRPPNTPTWCSLVDNIVKNTIFLLLSMTKVMCTKYLQERKDFVQAFYKDIKTSDLPKTTQPMLIIWEDQDQIFPLELAHRLKRFMIIEYINF